VTGRLGRLTLPPPKPTCPHCTSLVGWRQRSCCVYDGTRRVSQHLFAAICQNAWPRYRCICDTCTVLRAMEQQIDAAIRQRDNPPVSAKPQSEWKRWSVDNLKKKGA
jgi:hypothetical protein